jgi:protein-tyrosine phosphatase
MTFAPGKVHNGYTGHWDRDLDMDLERIRNVYDVSVIVSLMENPEYALVAIPDFFLACSAHDLKTIWYPIPDMNAPKNTKSFRLLIEDIVSRLHKGEIMMVHCRGGIGRTGMVASCVLTALGVRPMTAIKRIRDTRPRTITRRCQVAFVRRFANSMKGRVIRR